MKHVPLLSLLALLLAGCADDNATNPWSTAEERAASRAEQAAAKHLEESAKKYAAPAPAAKPVRPDISIFKQAEAAPKPEEAPKTAQANHALIVAIRADAGLIQFKRPEPTNPGDRLILTKDGASLLVIAGVVEGETVIADIAPKQIKVPAILVGDEVACGVQVEDKEKTAGAK